MSNSVLAGSLKFLSLGDVLQLLGSNASTGVLKIKSKYAQQPGIIYFNNGNPVDAADGSATGLDAINALFGWLDGEFVFNEEAVTAKNVIKKSRMEIILDCLSLLDDGQIAVLGPVSYEKKEADPSGKVATLPVIRGPLVDYMYVVDEEEVSMGSKIAIEGKHGSWFWVILEGTAEIVKESSEGLIKILRIGEGAFVGSIASFLMSGNVRSASIVAEGNVQLGVLDSQRLSTDFSRMTSDFRDLVLSLDRRLKQVTDRAVDIHLKRIQIEEFVKGKKPMIKQGSTIDNAYVIKQGEACIVRKTKHGYIPLANLAEGDFYGHVPFLDMGQEPFSASVLGSEDLQADQLDLAEIKKEHDQLSPTFKNIIEHLATCISVTTIMASDFNKKIVQKTKKK
ncbi:MAG: cyclic nucleotide-binding domain-containing protein [Proteobacteria bacterium]|nr:cyclic nucleotide-binding domain-containing protein [Pseudomonadota bacterium]